MDLPSVNYFYVICPSFVELASYIIHDGRGVSMRAQLKGGSKAGLDMAVAGHGPGEGLGSDNGAGEIEDDDVNGTAGCAR